MSLTYFPHAMVKIDVLISWVGPIGQLSFVIHVLFSLYEPRNFTHPLYTLYTSTTIDFVKVVKKFPVFVYVRYKQDK
jgi:hypothetical protein